MLKGFDVFDVLTLLSLVLLGVGCGVEFGLGYGLIVPGALLYPPAVWGSSRAGGSPPPAGQDQA